jgi:hypothetical protein
VAQRDLIRPLRAAGHFDAILSSLHPGRYRVRAAYIAATKPHRSSSAAGGFRVAH